MGTKKTIFRTVPIFATTKCAENCEKEKWLFEKTADFSKSTHSIYISTFRNTDSLTELPLSIEKLTENELDVRMSSFDGIWIRTDTRSGEMKIEYGPHNSREISVNGLDKVTCVWKMYRGVLNYPYKGVVLYAAHSVFAKTHPGACVPHKLS